MTTPELRETCAAYVAALSERTLDRDVRDKLQESWLFYRTMLLERDREQGEDLKKKEVA